MPGYPAAVSAVLHILLRVIQQALIERCPNAPENTRLGAVSFIHRFGDALMSTFILMATIPVLTLRAPCWRPNPLPADWSSFYQVNRPSASATKVSS